MGDRADLDHLDRLYVKKGAHAAGAAYPDLSAELRSSRSRLDNLRACIASVAYRLGCMSDPVIASLVSALETALVLDDKAAEANR